MSKVLVVEDNENNMELITFILEASGLEVLKAENGLKGVELATTTNPSYIILDIQLPDIDGFEVLKRVRDSEAGKDIPIIAMTSYAMTGDRERLLAAGCDGYIEKPIDPVIVMDQIAKVLKELR